MVAQINTTTIDFARQGVEITQQKYFDAGLVKIWSGEQNNVLLQLNYGESTTRYNNVVFVDRSYSDAAQMLNSSAVQNVVFSDEVVDTSMIVPNADSHITTYPVSYAEVSYVAVGEMTFDGVLEPLNIRRRAIYTTSDALGNVHGCNCNIGAGNIDSEKKSELLLTVNKFVSTFVPFNDAKQQRHTLMKTVGYFTNDNVVEPFDDKRLILNSIDNLRGHDMDAAVSLMSGSAENYINPGEYSMPSGFTYENCSVGTDSIAFGGTGY